MTATEDRPAVTASAPASPPAHKRPLVTRLSLGHLVMVVAALLAVLLNYTLLRAQDDTVRVAVVAQEVRAGMPVTPAALRFADVRVDDALLATLVQPGQLAGLEGYVATSTLRPGELVRAGDLQAPSAPAAQRAMSIPIEAQHAVAGKLSVGDRIDVIEVRDGRATYLVTGAEVLDVPSAEARGALSGLQSFSVTVAVDDATALRLAAAIRGGQLEIVRSTGASAAQTRSLDTTEAEEDTTDAEEDTSARSGQGTPRAPGHAAAAPEDD